MWFITKKKHEKIVEELRKKVWDNKIEFDKEKEILKSHLQLLNKQVLEKDLELKKRPNLLCKTSLIQKKIEELQKALTDG